MDQQAPLQKIKPLNKWVSQTPKINKPIKHYDKRYRPVMTATITVDQLGGSPKSAQAASACTYEEWKQNPHTVT